MPDDVGNEPTARVSNIIREIIDARSAPEERGGLTIHVEDQGDQVVVNFDADPFYREKVGVMTSWAEELLKQAGIAHAVAQPLTEGRALTQALGGRNLGKRITAQVVMPRDEAEKARVSVPGR